jgi:hypothetical protein
MSLPELIIFSNRRQAVTIARDVLEGRSGVIEGSRLLASLSHRVGLGEFDADFLPFVGIDSETDHLPIGEVRRHWAADALATKDAELAAAEAFYRQRAFEACSRLIARFADQKPPVGAYDHYTPDT